MHLASQFGNASKYIFVTKQNKIWTFCYTWWISTSNTKSLDTDDECLLVSIIRIVCWPSQKGEHYWNRKQGKLVCVMILYVTRSDETGNKSERLMSDIGINIPYLFNHTTLNGNQVFDLHSVILHYMYTYLNYNSMSLTNWK